MPSIVAGVIIFLVLFTYPFWGNLGNKTAAPQLVTGTTEKQCVEKTEFMKTSHMQLLDEWRDAVVRDGKRLYVSKLNGKQYDMSLQNTCTKCHSKKDQFCDRCHNYVNVAPNCWNCHIDPVQGINPQTPPQHQTAYNAHTPGEGVATDGSR